MRPNPERAVFLDRDGVLTRSLEINGKPVAPRCLEEFEIFPEAAADLARLKACGFYLIVATNQPDVGRGLMNQALVEEMHRRLSEALPLDLIKVCYAGTDADPNRKPNPGMLKEAAAELMLDLRQSFMVGDRWRDIDAGLAAGCRTVLVGDGYQEVPRINFHHQAANLTGAVAWILTQT